MAHVVVTLRIMPEGIDVDLSNIENKIKKEIELFCGKTQFKVTIQPVAFGLNSLNIIFVMDENKGSTEELEKNIASIAGVSSVEVTDVRRAVG